MTTEAICNLTKQLEESLVCQMDNLTTIVVFLCEDVTFRDFGCKCMCSVNRGCDCVVSNKRFPLIPLCNVSCLYYVYAILVPLDPTTAQCLAHMAISS